MLKRVIFWYDDFVLVLLEILRVAQREHVAHEQPNWASPVLIARFFA